MSVHCAHTGLTSGWAGLMLLFEAIVTDDSDLIFSPFWRQGLFVSAFCTRLALLPGTLDSGIAFGGAFGPAVLGASATAIQVEYSLATLSSCFTEVEVVHSFRLLFVTLFWLPSVVGLAFKGPQGILGCWLDSAPS